MKKRIKKTTKLIDICKVIATTNIAKIGIVKENRNCKIVNKPKKQIK